MNRNVITILYTLFLFGIVFGKDNRISMTLGMPDLIGIEYQRNIGNFYFAFSPHVLSSILFCNTRIGGTAGHFDLAIFPDVSFGYIFYRKNIFELGSDLIIMPAYFKQTFNDTIHSEYTQLSTGLRVIPSLTFSNITLSLSAGLFYFNDFKQSRYNGIKPSIALKAGYNF
jgi:hypothetical protein